MHSIDHLIDCNEASMSGDRAWFECGDHPISVRLEVADSFVKRFLGLMFRAPARDSDCAGLLITRCASVHTAFMRYAIDIVYLDRGGKVLRCVPEVKPWRASRGPWRHPGRTAHTIELPAGGIERLGIVPGGALIHPYFMHR